MSACLWRVETTVWPCFGLVQITGSILLRYVLRIQVPNRFFMNSDSKFVRRKLQSTSNWYKGYRQIQVQKQKRVPVFVFLPGIASLSLPRCPPRARPAAAGRARAPWQTTATPLLEHGARAPPGSKGASQVSPWRAATSATQAPLASSLPEGEARRPGARGGPPVKSAATVQCAAQRHGLAAAPGASGGPARSARAVDCATPRRGHRRLLARFRRPRRER